MGIFGSFSNDMAIDLGTANSLVFVKGQGIVLREPSIVAVQKGTRNVLAVGGEAKDMLGRTPANIIAIRPMRDGVIGDFRVTESMLRYFIKRAHRRNIFVRPRIIVSVPSGTTEVERKAVEESAEKAGAREVYLIEEPMAAAIGAGLPVDEPTGNMVVDVGGGTTEVAVISLAGIVTSRSIRVAGDELDEAIVQYLKQKYKLLVGERTAERIKLTVGSVFDDGDNREMEVNGRDLVTGLPKAMKITSAETREALAESVNLIVDTVKQSLERTPPELSADIIERGIFLAGGGALLRGMDRLLHQETGLSIKIAEDPLSCVVLGSGKCLDRIDLLRKIQVTSRPYD